MILSNCFKTRNREFWGLLAPTSNKWVLFLWRFSCVILYVWCLLRWCGIFFDKRRKNRIWWVYILEIPPQISIFSGIAQKTFPQKFLRQAKEECDFRRGKACLKTFLHLQNPTAQCGCGGGTMSIFSRSIGAGLRLKPFLSFNSHHRPGMPRLSYIFLFLSSRILLLLKLDLCTLMANCETQLLSAAHIYCLISSWTNLPAARLSCSPRLKLRTR